MKIRTDFVTNSSSSNFILARKDKLTTKQKQAIVKFVEDNMLGTKILGPEDNEETIKKFFKDEEWYINKDCQAEIRSALKNGQSIYMGNINFEMPESDYAELFQGLWHALSKVEDFCPIDDDLSY